MAHTTSARHGTPYRVCGKNHRKTTREICTEVLQGLCVGTGDNRAIGNWLCAIEVEDVGRRVEGLFCCTSDTALAEANSPVATFAKC